MEPVNKYLQWFDLFLKLGLPLAIILGVAYSLYRGGTLHYLHDKVWTLISFRRKFYDNNLNAYWENIRDIEMLRFKTGLKITKKQDVEDVKYWFEQRQIDIFEVSQVLDNFDHKEKIFFSKSYRKMWWVFFILIAAFFIVGATCAITANSYKYAHLTFKDSGLSFKSNGEEVQVGNGEIYRSDCERNFNINDLEEDEFESICIFLNSKDNFYKKYLNEQNFILQTFALFFYLLSMLMVRPLWKTGKIIKIQNKLDSLKN